MGSDPVSAAYRDIFRGRVAELPSDLDRAALKEEMEWRYRHFVPPGYKDNSKADEGIGDYIIWKTILDLANKQNRPCIFVTEDAKSDWWVQSEGAFQPRLELVDEYRRHSNGSTIHLMALSDFLATFGAQEGVVEDAKRAEESPQLNVRVHRSPLGRSSSRNQLYPQLSFVELARMERQFQNEIDAIAIDHNKIEQRLKAEGDSLAEDELERLLREKAILFRQLGEKIKEKGGVTREVGNRIEPDG